MKLKKQILQKDLRNHDRSKLYVLLDDVVPKNVLARKNKAHAWQPGYNEKYDIIVISKDGTIGDIYFINNLKIALPSTPKLTSKKKKNSIGNQLIIQKNLKEYKPYFNGMKHLQFLKING